MATRFRSLILGVLSVGVALLAVLALTNTVFAGDFTANGDITVSSVTMGDSSANMIIFSGATADSWTYNAGAFTVVNPGAFTIGSSNSSVVSIKATQSSNGYETCANNTTPGTSSITLPTTVSTYTIVPQTVACGGGGVSTTSPGGGGGGGGTIEGTSAIGSVTSSGKSAFMTLNAQANFATAVSSGGSENHTLKVTVIDSINSRVTVVIQSNPITLTLNLSETKKVDLNGDGINDISVKFNGLTGGKADIIMANIVDAEKASAQGLKLGDLVKTATYPAVYYIDAQGKRHLFSNEVTFWTWNSGKWADQGVKVISQAVFDALPVSDNVTARSGVNLVKFQNSPQRVFAVTPGAVLREVVTSAGSDAAAKALYGADYVKKVILIQDSFESNYTKGAALTASSKLPDGSLIQYQGSSDIYYISAGNKQKLSSGALTANKFKTTAIITAPASITYTDGEAISAEVTTISRVIQ